MRNILHKEMFLSASPLTYYFILFGFMFFLPGYPVLCSVFFVTLGIFNSFQTARESNDIVFSALLPIAKRDIVKGKFVFVCFTEFCGLLLMALAVILRMTVFSDAEVYRNNALMNANLFALGAAFLIFGLFNLVFVSGFFKTAYKFGAPFFIYIVVCFSVMTLFEALHYFPGLSALNSFGFENLGIQLVSLFAGMLLYALITLISYKISCRRFEKIDL